MRDKELLSGSKSETLDSVLNSWEIQPPPGGGGQQNQNQEGKQAFFSKIILDLKVSLTPTKCPYPAFPNTLGTTQTR